MRRSDPHYLAAKELLSTKPIGDIVGVTVIHNAYSPYRWRNPGTVKLLKEKDTDWKAFLMGRPMRKFDPHQYAEFRLYRDFSTGIIDQWMTHLVDTIHMMSGATVSHCSLIQGVKPTSSMTSPPICAHERQKRPRVSAPRNPAANPAWLKPSMTSPSIQTIPALPAADEPCYPSEHAAVAGTAAAMLTYLFPGDAPALAGMAKEAGQSRLLAGKRCRQSDDDEAAGGRQ